MKLVLQLHALTINQTMMKRRNIVTAKSFDRVLDIAPTSSIWKQYQNHLDTILRSLGQSETDFKYPKTYEKVPNFPDSVNLGMPLAAASSNPPPVRVAAGFRVAVESRKTWDGNCESAKLENGK